METLDLIFVLILVPLVAFVFVFLPLKALQSLGENEDNE